MKNGLDHKVIGIVIFGPLVALIIFINISWLFHRFSHESTESFKIPVNYMAPTYFTGDSVGLKILTNQTRSQLKRGNVVGYFNKTFGLGRIIGISGDTVEIIGKKIKINNKFVESHNLPGEECHLYKLVEERSTGIRYDCFSEKVDEITFKTLWHDMDGRSFAPKFVSPGTYYILGDNRSGSYDSRFTGLITAADISSLVQ